MSRKPLVVPVQAIPAPQDEQIKALYDQAVLMNMHYVRLVEKMRRYDANSLAFAFAAIEVASVRESCVLLNSIIQGKTVQPS